MNGTSTNLPALRCLGDLADVRPTIVVDSREQIEAGEYRSGIAPRAVLSTLRAIEARFDVPVCFAPTPTAAALEIEAWVFWFARANGVTRGRISAQESELIPE